MTRDNETIPDLLSRTIRQATGLTSNILQLASAEVGAGLGNLAKGLGVLVAGLMVILIGLLFLLHGAVAWLVLFGWSEAASYGMVGGGAIVLAILLMIGGALFLRNASPVPRRALSEVQSLLNARVD